MKKHPQISFWNYASNAFKLVNKIYTDEVQNNWIEKCIHKNEENYFCLEIRRKKILYFLYQCWEYSISMLRITLNLH